MANSKISGLTAATTPLAGTEELALLQTSDKRITVADFAAGAIKSNATTGVLQVVGPVAASTRVMTTPNANFSVARTDALQTLTGNQTITNGNVIVSSGYGIDFSATEQSGGMTSQLLNWYEEGTWTPVLAFGGASVGITYAAQAGTYTRTGRVVTGRFVIVLSSKGSSTGTATIKGLPFTAGADIGSAVTEVCSNFVIGPPTQGYCSNAGTNIVPWAISATNATLLTDTNFANNTRLDMWFQYNV